VAPVVLVSIAVLYLVRRGVSTASLKKHHDVAGYTFSIIGVLYSVILGFTVINVQERYNKADESAQTEATMIADLYRDAAYFDADSRETIRGSLRRYVEYVIEKEWHLPREATRWIHADLLLQDIWKSYEGVDLQNEKTKIWYEQTISKLERLMNARLAREFYSWEHLSGMMWTILITGGIVTVCFMFFFGLENLRMQMIMTALLSGYLAFMLFLVYSLDHVFQSSIRLTPRPFEETWVIFDRLDKQF